MAPAQAASASAGTDSIKGLAQSVAKTGVSAPARCRTCLAARRTDSDHRFSADHGRRRHGPDQRSPPPGGRRRRRATSKALADLLSERLDRDTQLTKADLARRVQDILDQLQQRRGAASPHVPGQRRRRQRHRRHAQDRRAIGRQLIDTLGPAQPLTTFGASAGVLEIPLDDDTSAFATVRNLKAPLGQLAIIRAARVRARVLALRHRADRDAVRHHRLRRADPRLCLPLAGDPRARSRRHLRHGARPHRHRAQPRPLRPVGLGPRARAHLLVAFDVRHARPRAAQRSPRLRRCLRPSSIPTTFSSTSSPPSSPTARRQSIDRDFRMRHAKGHWVWLRARCEIVHNPNEPGPHLIGIAVDITEQKSSRREDRRRRHSPARRHRNHPRSLRAVGRR